MRKIMGRVFRSKAYDLVLAASIVFNMYLLILETDSKAKDSPVPGWVRTCNSAILSIYVLEVAGRIFCFQTDFFHSIGNVIDVCIVSADVFLLLGTALAGDDSTPSFAILRIFRLGRLCRARRIIMDFPELHIMITGLTGALKAIFWGMILIVVLIVASAILAVQVLHPLNQKVAHEDCERCERAFESVWAASLTFTQHVIVGDSWGKVSLPMIERYPHTYVIFLGVFVCLGMAVLNLILAVVIDSANQARVHTDQEVAHIKGKEYEKARKSLLNLCEKLDENKDGGLSLEELMQGFSIPEFCDAMKVLDVKPKDLTALFRVMDDNGNGTVEFDEFVDFFYAMKAEDPHTTTCMIKHYVAEIQREVKEEMDITRKMHGEVMALLTKHFQGASFVADATVTDEGAVEEAAEAANASHADSTDIQETLEGTNSCLEESHTGDMAWLQRSQQKLDKIMQDIRRDIQSHGMILASLSETSLGRDLSLQYPLLDGASLADVAKLQKKLPDAGLSLAVYPASKAEPKSALHAAAARDTPLWVCCGSQRPANAVRLDS